MADDQEQLSPLYAGRCRRNCLTNEEAFLAGCALVLYHFDEHTGQPSIAQRKELYREWNMARRKGIRDTHKTSRARNIF